MTLWVPLDANYEDDDKIAAVSALAELVFIRSLALAKRLGTDGAIARPQLRRLDDKLDDVGGDRSAIAKELVEAGLWTETDNGWQIASWTTWNRTTADVEALTTRKSAGGKLGNHRKWRHDGPVEQCPKCYPPSDSDRSSDSDSESDPSRSRSDPVGREETEPEGEGEKPQPHGEPSDSDRSTDRAEPSSPRHPDQLDPDVADRGSDAVPSRSDNRWDAALARNGQRIAHKVAALIGWQAKPDVTLDANYQSLLETALTVEGVPDHRVSMALIGEYIERLLGPLPDASWKHLHGLVGRQGGPVVLRQAAEAIDWGAGANPKYADDPLALTKYLAAMGRPRKGGK